MGLVSPSYISSRHHVEPEHSQHSLKEGEERKRYFQASRRDEGAHIFSGKVSSPPPSHNFYLLVYAKVRSASVFPPVRAAPPASLGQISMGLMDKQMDLVPRAASPRPGERGNI